MFIHAGSFGARYCKVRVLERVLPAKDNCVMNIVGLGECRTDNNSMLILISRDLVPCGQQEKNLLSFITIIIIILSVTARRFDIEPKQGESG